MTRILTNLLANCIAVLLMPGVLLLIGMLYIVDLITGEAHDRTN